MIIVALSFTRPPLYIRLQQPISLLIVCGKQKIYISRYGVCLRNVCSTAARCCSIKRCAERYKVCASVCCVSYMHDYSTRHTNSIYLNVKFRLTHRKSERRDTILLLLRNFQFTQNETQNALPTHLASTNTKQQKNSFFSRSLLTVVFTSAYSVYFLVLLSFNLLPFPSACVFGGYLCAMGLGI